MQKSLIAVAMLGLFLFAGIFVLSINNQHSMTGAVMPNNNINIQLDRNNPVIAQPVVTPVVPVAPRWGFGVWWAPRPVVTGHVDVNVQRNVTINKDINRDRDVNVNKDIQRNNTPQPNPPKQHMGGGNGQPQQRGGGNGQHK